MITFLRPIASAMIGIALTLFGLIYAVTGYPGAAPFGVLWASMPALFSILLFALGLIAVVIGLILLVTGVQGARRRFRQVGGMYRRPPGPGGPIGPHGAYAADPDYDEDDERYWQPRNAYR